MKVALSAGQTSDYRGYDALTDSELPAPKVLIADGLPPFGGPDQI